jgi:hypothetical protein
MELPTSKDIEDMVDNIYRESNKVFTYSNSLTPQVNFMRFLGLLNQRSILLPIPPYSRLEKDMLILQFQKSAFPYQILTAYMYALAFIRHDKSINIVLIEMKI